MDSDACSLEQGKQLVCQYRSGHFAIAHNLEQGKQLACQYRSRHFAAVSNRGNNKSVSIGTDILLLGGSDFWSGIAQVPWLLLLPVRTFFTMEGGKSEFANFTLPDLNAFLEACSQNVSGNKQ